VTRRESLESAVASIDRAPFALFDAFGRGATNALDLAQRAMFVEEQSAFAAEVGEQWLPRRPPVPDVTR